jgi:serine/threonine-protein kinase
MMPSTPSRHASTVQGLGPHKPTTSPGRHADHAPAASPLAATLAGNATPSPLAATPAGDATPSPLAATLAGRARPSPLAASLAGSAGPFAPAIVASSAAARGVETVISGPSPATHGGKTARSGPSSAVLAGLAAEPDLAATVAEGRPGAAGVQLVTDRSRYEPIRKLGEGSFGQVLLVQDNDIARPVAMKRLKSEWHQGETLARFVDEIQAIGQLEHPGIVPIHDVGLDERGYYFIMKYVEGETLEQIVEELRTGDAAYCARFTYEVRVGIFQQLLRAIQFAHARGVVHRDIKPANVMVGPYGEVMIMDWGLAKRQEPPTPRAPSRFVSLVASDERGPASIDQPPLSTSRLTQTQSGAVVGSPAYMSPEQARGDHAAVDARSEVYSLSALFYELLTLDHYLTPKQSMQELIDAVSREEPLTAIGMHHRYGIPPEYTFFIRRGLSKDPAQRFQSVAEMAGALQDITNGDIPVQCPCTGLKAVGNRWFDFIDAHPIAAVATAVLTTGAALFGVIDLALRLVHAIHG